MENEVLSEVFSCDESHTKNAFQYVERMLSIFRAIVKFCGTNRLFRSISVQKIEKFGATISTLQHFMTNAKIVVKCVSHNEFHT